MILGLTFDFAFDLMFVYSINSYSCLMVIVFVIVLCTDLFGLAVVVFCFEF